MGYNSYKLFEDIRLLVQDRPRMSLQEISRRLGIERHTIERVVLKYSRMTFRRYRNGCMAEKATRLLRNSNTSIKEVAINPWIRIATCLFQGIRLQSRGQPIDLSKRAVGDFSIQAWVEAQPVRNTFHNCLLLLYSVCSFCFQTVDIYVTNGAVYVVLLSGGTRRSSNVGPRKYVRRPPRVSRLHQIPDIESLKKGGVRWHKF